MENADNQGNPGQGQGTAPGQELQIPKHRFDEIQARLREKEQELALKDRLYMEQMQLQSTQRRQAEPEFTLSPEDTGLDPQTHKAVMMAAEKIATHKLSQTQKQFNGLIGQMANELEMTKFVAEYGTDKKKYLPLIREYQQRHAQATGGGYMDAETAYKLVRFDEIQSNDKRSGYSQTQAPQGSQSQDAPPPSVPNAANTRVQNTPQSSAPKGFHELSLEEQEARLEEAFGSGAVV